MVSASTDTQPRICQTPGSLVVEGTLFRRFALYVYVPPSTSEFTLGIFDQPDDIPGDEPTSFALWSPDGTKLPLDRPMRDAWSEYSVDVKGNWGVWQLRVEASSPPCRNEFAIKTTGEVDLYAKPDPCVSYRGAISFTRSQLSGDTPQAFAVQVPDVGRLRFNFQLPSAPIAGEEGVTVALEPPAGVDAEQRWVGMDRDRFSAREFWRMEYLEATGSSLEGLWRLTLQNVHDIYHLGVEQQVRLFFHESPMMPMPVRAEAFTAAGDGPGALPVRLELRSRQTAREGYSGFSDAETPYVAFTGRDGSGDVFLMPDVGYTLNASRGFEFGSRSVDVPASSRRLEVSLPKRLERKPGWYCGDCHAHSLYSDGSFTPAQVVEAARGEGLDWIVLTDHGAGHDVPTVIRAHEEAVPLSEPGKFIVVPGEEFSSGSFHANVINGTVNALATDSLQVVIDAAREADTEDRPLALAWNHPFGHGKELVGSNLEGLPLVEVWNVKQGSGEPETTRMWWGWLNSGKRVFAETGTDSHHRAANPYGRRRTYVYLGDAELTADNVTRALRDGRSFLSRGALLYFTASGQMSGGSVTASRLEVRVEVASALPVDRVDIVGNGEVVHSFAVGGQTRFDDEVTIDAAPGWYLAQVFGDAQTEPPLAMSNPVFVEGEAVRDMPGTMSRGS